jgi:resorcinol 4-hydroxylase (FADH2)
MATRAEAAIPSPDELVARARALAPGLRARAQEAEQARTVPAASIAEIRDAGLFRILQPRAFGGYELSFRTAFDVQREIGAGCASTAWVSGLAIYTNWMLALFPVEAQREFWRDDPDTLSWGTLPQTRDVRRVPGGYRVSGIWPFSSGCDHAAWMLLGFFAPHESGEGPGAPSFAVFPRGDFEIDDNWHTVGLAATGSKNVVVNDAFVPAHRTLAISRVLTGEAPGAAGRLYRQPFVSIVPFALLGTAVGALQGAIDAFVEGLAGRKTRGAVIAGGRDVTSFASVQSRLGEAKGALMAANALTWRILDRAETGLSPERDARIEARLTHAYALRLVQQGIDALYGAVGGPGLFLDQPVQRAWRDIHAVAKHISLNWDSVSAMAGQHAFGLEPQGQY